MTEVMIGGALLAGIGLAGARMFKDQRQSQSKLDHEQLLMTFHQNLTKFLQDEKNCNATFKDIYGYTPAQVAASDISSLYPCSNCTTMGVNYDASATTARGTAFTSVGQWIENTNGATTNGLGIWRITDFSWKSTATATGAFVLRVTYAMSTAVAGSRATRNHSVSKDVQLNFRFTQNADPNLRYFRECISGKESSVNNLQHDVCESMGTSTGVIMTWSDTEQKCVAQGTTAAPVRNCTTPNQVIEGVNANGTVNCKSLTDGVTPTSYMNSTGCSPTNSVRLNYDPGTNTYRVTCY